MKKISFIQYVKKVFTNDTAITLYALILMTLATLATLFLLTFIFGVVVGLILFFVGGVLLVLWWSYIDYLKEGV